MGSGVDIKEKGSCGGSKFYIGQAFSSQLGTLILLGTCLKLVLYNLKTHVYHVCTCIVPLFFPSSSRKRTWINAIYQFLVFIIWLSLLGSVFHFSFCTLFVSSTKARQLGKLLITVCTSYSN